MPLRKIIASTIIPVSKYCKGCDKVVEATIKENEIICPNCHEVLDDKSEESPSA